MTENGCYLKKLAGGLGRLGCVGYREDNDLKVTITLNFPSGLLSIRQLTVGTGSDPINRLPIDQSPLFQERVKPSLSNLLLERLSPVLLSKGSNLNDVSVRRLNCAFLFPGKHRGRLLLLAGNNLPV